MLVEGGFLEKEEGWTDPRKEPSLVPWSFKTTVDSVAKAVISILAMNRVHRGRCSC